MKKTNLILLTLLCLIISCANAPDKKIYKKNFKACTKYYSDIICAQYSFKEMKFIEIIETEEIDINGAMIFPKDVWLKELLPALKDSNRFDFDSIK